MSSVPPAANSSQPDSLRAAAQLSETFRPVRELYLQISDEIAKLFVGQDELVLGSLTALFAGGHVLIESVPGLGKTLFVRTLGRVSGVSVWAHSVYR